MHWWGLTLRNLAGDFTFAQSSEEATHSDVSVALRHRDALQSVFDEVRLVDVMDSGDTAHLSLMKRPDLGVTLTKLHCWTLTQYSKCVFMDADTLVRKKKHFRDSGFCQLSRCQ